MVGLYGVRPFGLFELSAGLVFVCARCDRISKERNTAIISMGTGFLVLTCVCVRKSKIGGRFKSSCAARGLSSGLGAARYVEFSCLLFGEGWRGW